jgi:hypothetical protein
MRKPLLSIIKSSRKSLSASMIATLLESDCDPNERISGHGHAMATP